jgi:hypothetical protein
MPIAYTFIWLSDNGGVAAVDSARCFSDADALRTASALLRDATNKWRNCARIEAYSGVRFVDRVQHAVA